MELLTMSEASKIYVPLNVAPHRKFYFCDQHEPICCASKNGLKSTEYISFKLHNIPVINLSILKANSNGELKLYGDHGKLNEKENGLKVKIASHCCSKWSEIQINIELYRILLKG